MRARLFLRARLALRRRLWRLACQVSLLPSLEGRRDARHALERIPVDPSAWELTRPSLESKEYLRWRASWKATRSFGERVCSRAWQSASKSGPGGHHSCWLVHVGIGDSRDNAPTQRSFSHDLVGRFLLDVAEGFDYARGHVELAGDAHFLRHASYARFIRHLQGPRF